MACGAHGQLVQTGRQWRCTASCAVWAPGWLTVTAAALLLHRGPRRLAGRLQCCCVVAPQATTCTSYTGGHWTLATWPNSRFQAVQYTVQLLSCAGLPSTARKFSTKCNSGTSSYSCTRTAVRLYEYGHLVLVRARTLAREPWYEIDSDRPAWMSLLHVAVRVRARLRARTVLIMCNLPP
jgi:hypothetical protein